MYRNVVYIIQRHNKFVSYQFNLRPLIACLDPTKILGVVAVSESPNLQPIFLFVARVQYTIVRLPNKWRRITPTK